MYHFQGLFFHGQKKKSHIFQRLYVEEGPFILACVQFNAAELHTPHFSRRSDTVSAGRLLLMNRLYLTH